MIIADRKPMDEILGMVSDAKKILVLGCRGCVTVCSAGGEREVEILASLIRLGMQKQGKKIETIEGTLKEPWSDNATRNISTALMSGKDSTMPLSPWPAAWALILSPISAPPPRPIPR